MAVSFYPRFEFSLTVKKIGEKNTRDYLPRGNEPVEEVELEKLQFNSLTAVEVIRKLLDYINQNQYGI